MMSTSWFYALLPAWWPGTPSGVGTASGSTLTGTAADFHIVTILGYGVSQDIETAIAAGFALGG